MSDKLTKAQRELLEWIDSSEREWLHPLDMGRRAAERFTLRDLGLIEASEPTMLVINYRITESGREALRRSQ